MANDIEIISGQDQPIPLDTFATLNQLDELYETSLSNKNYNGILSLISNISASTRVMGIALAKLLYQFHRDWKEFNIDDDFFDVIFHYVGKSKTTVLRYITAWKMYAEELVPLEYKQRILALPMRSQIAISAAISQGYEIETTSWNELAHSPDVSSILAKMREIKGSEPRKGTMVLMLRRSGNIMVSVDGRLESVGMLNILSEDEIVKKAISRILDKSGIIES